MRKDCLSANINLNQFGSRYVLFAAGAHSWNPAHSFSLNLFGTLPRLFDLIATVLLNFYGPSTNETFQIEKFTTFEVV